METNVKGKGLALPTKILIGLLIGATAGIVANAVLGGDHAAVAWVNRYIAGPVGQIFLRMLFMIVVPLVFASIALGVAGLGDIRRLGGAGARTLGFFLFTTLLSAALGIILVLVFRPGASVAPETSDRLMQQFAEQAGARVQTSEQSPFGIDMLVNVVTRNPVRSAVELDLLGLIFFSLVFGAALTLIRKDAARPMMAWLESLQAIVITIVDIAMRLAPYGVAALIFGVTSIFAGELLVPLAVYVGTVLLGLFIHGAITMSLIVRLTSGVSPGMFYRRIRASMITAFSTSSSAATLPTNLAVSTRNFGVPKHIAGFVLPLGNTMCMNGTSLFEGITVLFLAQVFGVALSIPDMIVIVVMCVVTAIGAAGVPGGSIPLLVGILVMFGIPGEGIALVLGVDRILDMSRTVLNIIGDHAATLYVAKSEGEWSVDSIPEVEPELDLTGAGAP